MAFNTLFFIFLYLPLFLIIYWLTPRRLKGLCLVLGSLFFYSYFSLKSAFIFAVFITIVYLYSQILIKSGYRQRVLVIGIVGLVNYLVYYKYLGFIAENLNALAGRDVFTPSISSMPLGVSFYVFTTISFIVDIYRTRTQKIGYLEFLNYVAFFPKVVSGPLMRWHEFNYQGISKSNISRGLSRFIVGLSKKVILAYYFGQSADLIWSNLASGIDTPTAWLGAFAYTLQIYFDFSGYSDMAIGIGELLGYRISENFNFPYLATSIGDFWRRWHISLGTWFRDYIYFPLGGSRRGNTQVNLAIVFLVTGIWHGASWSFIVWGLWHGLIRIIESRFKKSMITARIPKTIQWIVTMLAVIIGWVFFRSNTLTEAWSFLKIMFGVSTVPRVDLIFSWPIYYDLRVIVLGLLGIFFATLFGHWKWDRTWYSLERTNVPAIHIAQSLVLVLLLALSIMMIVSSGYTPFIYFQF